MGIDIGAMLNKGNALLATAQVPVTDLSPETDGGASAVGTVRSIVENGDGRATLYTGVGIVVASIAALWFFGGIAFRGLPSL